MPKTKQRYICVLLVFMYLSPKFSLEYKIGRSLTEETLNTVHHKKVPFSADANSDNAATDAKTDDDKQSNEANRMLDELALQLKVSNRTIIRFTPEDAQTPPFQPLSAARKASLTHDQLLGRPFKDIISKKKKKNSTEENNASTVDCSQFGLLENNEVETDTSSFCYSPSDSLTCYQDPIFCKVYHMSGKRELEWPVYGEYSYLSHKNWVKILQHGGIVFLYHPCANKSLVAKLRALAGSCLHRYVLTPYEKLTYQKPLGLVSWGCYSLMKEVNMTESRDWIKAHAYKAPASHIHKNGTYETKLLKASKVLTDVKDSFICPDEHQKAIFQASPTVKIESNQPHHRHIGEELILKRLAKVRHAKRTHRKVSRHLTVNSKKAFSAFFSLVFLCVLLSILLLYTKLWRPGGDGSKCLYEKLIDHRNRYECNESYNELGLLKSSQNFINRFRKKKRGRTLDPLSKVKLLDTINEEDDESDELF